MKSATKVFIGEFFLVEENTGFINLLGLTILVVAKFGNAELSTFASDFMVLPHLWFKSLGSFSNTSFILFAVVISAIAATSMGRKCLIDSFAAITEDAVPVRGKPGQIALEDLKGVLWIGKLYPFASKA
jgi:hypothetical protein